MYVRLLFACRSDSRSPSVFVPLCNIPSGLCISSSQFRVSLSPPAMDARTAKRVAQVQHIKGEKYYAPVAEEPDPVAMCATRMWKFKMKVWVETLKKTHTRNQDQLPQQEEDPAPEVTTGVR